MSLPRSAARFVLGYVGLVEGTAAMIRFRERKAAFQAAAERAAALDRRLVVIGDPDAGMHTRLMRAYGCGDVCVDLNGCPKCPLTVVARAAGTKHTSPLCSSKAPEVAAESLDHHESRLRRLGPAAPFRTSKRRSARSPGLRGPLTTCSSSPYSRGR